jgi:hypothetical protein
MLTELRYHAKIHAISNKPREKKILQILPLFFFFFFLLLLLNKNNKQYGNDIICKGKIKLVDAQ